MLQQQQIVPRTSAKASTYWRNKIDKPLTDDMATADSKKVLTVDVKVTGMNSFNNAMTRRLCGKSGCKVGYARCTKHDQDDYTDGQRINFFAKLEVNDEHEITLFPNVIKKIVGEGPPVVKLDEDSEIEGDLPVKFDLFSKYFDQRIFRFKIQRDIYRGETTLTVVKAVNSNKD